MPDGQDQQVAKMLYEDLRRQAKEIADMRGMAPGNKKLTTEEETALFWKMADGWTPDKEIALLAEGKTREAIGLMKYDKREGLAKSNGRALSKYEQAKWYDQMARKTDPSWAPPPNKMQAPPLPPGLEPPAITDTPTVAPPTEAGLSFGG